MKFCSDCGATGSVWMVNGGQETCRCGSTNLHILDDQVVDLEFQSLVEKTFTPFDRFSMEADAQLIEGEHNEDQAFQ